VWIRVFFLFLEDNLKPFRGINLARLLIANKRVNQGQQGQVRNARALTFNTSLLSFSLSLSLSLSLSRYRTSVLKVSECGLRVKIGGCGSPCHTSQSASRAMPFCLIAQIQAEYKNSKAIWRGRTKKKLKKKFGEQ
jgi:hypothetical protein